MLAILEHSHGAEQTETEKKKGSSTMPRTLPSVSHSTLPWVPWAPWACLVLHPCQLAVVSTLCALPSPFLFLSSCFLVFIFCRREDYFDPCVGSLWEGGCGGTEQLTSRWPGRREDRSRKGTGQEIGPRKCPQRAAFSTSFPFLTLITTQRCHHSTLCVCVCV